MNKKNLVQLIVLALTILISVTSFGQNLQQSGSKINFSKLQVSTDKKKVFISWSTDNTIATNYFEIQKSNDGINFKTVALVLGPDPRQSGDSYSCFENYPGKNDRNSYYRLKHIDTNGVEQLSETMILAKL
jgi:hypothetical protein